MDHQAEFERLVRKTLGAEASDLVQWSSPRLLCIAGDFATYDLHAVQQISRGIELVKYRRYGDGLLLLELLGSDKSTPKKPGSSKLALRSVPSKVRADRLFRVTSDGMHTTSRRMETYKSIVDGMPLADFKGNKGDLTKLLKNGQVRLGTS